MRTMDGLMSKYDALLSAGSDNTLAVTNLTGHPAIALKSGVANNHPTSLMITGRLYDEGSLCRIAMAFEQATEWKDRHPRLD
jgi:aspartyl-tRNA(Asn)/glutamyl-tRNA(Gln) amidotransferase subunit A